MSHSAGMHNIDISIAGISKRLHFASLHCIFSAYPPTHIKFLTEFHCIFFGTTCISFPFLFASILCEEINAYICIIIPNRSLGRVTIPDDWFGLTETQKERLQTMRFGVSRKKLMIIAGLVWIVAGANILHIGIDCWLSVDCNFFLLLLGAVVVFLVFFICVFNKMFHKHRLCISQKGDSNCPMGFFDAFGWIIMAFMMTMGIAIRHYGLMPLWFIAMFYTGLSSALTVTGIRFLLSSRWGRSRKPFNMI